MIRGRDQTFLLAIVALLCQGCGQSAGCGSPATRTDQGAPAVAQGLDHNAGKPTPAPAQWCRRTYDVPKAMLGHSVTPFALYVDAALVRLTNTEGRPQVRLKVLVQRGRRGTVSGSPLLRRTQLRPDLCFWQLTDDDGNVTREWLAGFLENRDGIYHTIVTLPLSELQHSYLVMLFEDVDEAYVGREDVEIRLDMREYDWAAGETNRWLDQSVGVASVWE